MKKGALIKLIMIAVLLVGITTALLFAYKNYKNKYAENKKRVDYGELVTAPAGEALFILENAVYDYNARIVDDRYYIKFDTVTALFNDQFSVDAATGYIYYTVPKMNMCIVPDQGWSAVSGVSDGGPEGNPIITIDGELYIDTDFVGQYSDVDISYYHDPDRIVVYYQHKENLYYTLKDDAPFHVSFSIKSEIYDTLSAGTKVAYISGTGNAKADFYCVMTEDGRFGYVQNKHLSESFYEPWQSEHAGPDQWHIYMEEPIRLGWHYTASEKGNESYDSIIKNTDGLNVYSPRWMYVADNSGNIVNYGENYYVDRAHAAGMQVWVLVQDFDGPKDLDVAELLANRESREYLATNIVEATVALGADGINLDMEEVDKRSAKDFVQFVKELSIYAHSEGLILSVDNLVPLGYNTYELDVQAQFADYIVIMAYDEHYAGSKEAGSVASISYTRKAIVNTAASVPRNQIVISIPFYTRLWETDAKGQLTSSAISMTKANAHVAKNGLEKTWNDEVCQYYISYTLGNSFYQMWLEDNESLKIKLEAIQNAGVAGMAAWRLGFEEDDTWDLIKSIIN